MDSSRQHPHASQKANDKTKMRFVEGDQSSLIQSHMAFGAHHGLFVRIIQVLIEDLGHGEHVDPILLKHSAHRIVTANLASIARILKLIFTDVLPYPLDSLWTRKLVRGLVEE